MIRELKDPPPPGFGDVGYYETCDMYIDMDGNGVLDFAEFLRESEGRDLTWMALDDAIYIWAGDLDYARSQIIAPGREYVHTLR